MGEFLQEVILVKLNIELLFIFSVSKMTHEN